jgi:endonuclease YncB( thermonuclease family)
MAGSTLKDTMKTLSIIVAIACLTTPVFADPSVITGRSHVVDSDTVDVAGVRVRLKGVDAGT